MALYRTPACSQDHSYEPTTLLLQQSQSNKNSFQHSVSIRGTHFALTFDRLRLVMKDSMNGTHRVGSFFLRNFDFYTGIFNNKFLNNFHDFFSSGTNRPDARHEGREFFNAFSTCLDISKYLYITFLY